MEKFSLFVLVAPMLLLSMVAHEYAHGYAALRQGDDTALSLGRLTWNPLKHIDPWLTVIMPLVSFFVAGIAFGGAKPVPVDPRRYRNYVRGDIIVSLAGIATNLALAVLLLPLVIGLGVLARQAPALGDSVSLLQIMLLYGITINLVLASFNLIPIPPLDGWHVVKHLLPFRAALAYQRLGRYGLLIVFLLVGIGRPLLTAWMAPAFRLNDWALRVAAPYVELGRWASLVGGP
ncbi:MAG TPA: site-2 protease family protein [Gemmatimonadaceae bacterium]|nr:site-2 protease family protein [Gemmatimonadaceae bacterium]